MKLNSRDLAARLRADGLPAAVLLYGSEQGLLGEAADTLASTALGPDGDADFDVESFHAGDVDEARLMAACQCLPFSAVRRVVRLKEGDELKKEVVATLLAYLKRPAPQTLFLITAANLDGKSPLRKAFEADKQAWCVPFFPLDARSLPGWIRSFLSERGFSVDPPAVANLAERLGNDTAMVRMELEKLIFFMGEERRIGLDEVLSSVGEITGYTSSDLVSASFLGETGRALAILDRLLAAGGEPLMLLAMLTRQARLLAQGRKKQKEGLDPKQVAGKLRIFWKEEGAFFAQLRRLGDARLADFLLACQEADFLLKSNGGAASQVLGGLVMSLADGR